MSATSTRARLHIASYILIALLILLNLLVFPRWAVDDAYIIFRYAENFVQHGQLTFNVGEDPVEGYTGILLPLIIAAALELGISPSIAAHLAGLVSFLLSMLILYRLLLRFHIPGPIRISSLLIVATAGSVYTHVYSGMETWLFTALLLGASLQLCNLLRTGSVSFWSHAYLAVTLLFLSLCRPEGIVYALIVAGILIAVSMADSRSLSPTLAYVSGLAMPLLVYFMWRWSYYGYPLPNTFYAKLDNGLSGSTLQSLKDFGRQYLLLPVVGVVTAWIATLGETCSVPQRGRKRCCRSAVFLTVGTYFVFALIVLAQYLRSNLVMNFSYRFYMPLYPMAVLTAAWLLTPSLEAARSYRKTRPWRYTFVIAILCLLLLAQVSYQMKKLVLEEIPFAYRYRTWISEMHRPAGKYLRDHVPDSEWLVVHIDAGAIPYYSGLKTVDFGALNDEYLAHHDLSLEERVDYFFSVDPGAVVFTSYDWGEVDHGPEAEAIISDPRFRDYALVRKFDSSTGEDYFEFVFLRRDLVSQPEEP